MTNWPLIGPADTFSSFEEQASASTSIGGLVLEKDSALGGGSWQEYSASWPTTTNSLDIFFSDLMANRQSSLYVGVGGAGAERTRLELPFPDYSPNMTTDMIRLPLSIRQGERVVVKTSSAFNGTIHVGLRGYNDPLFRTDFGYFDLVGKVSTTSLTVVDPGGTLNTKGAWTEIASTSPANWKALIAWFGQQASAGTAVVNHLFDIGFGAAGSETTLLSDFHVRRSGRGVGRGRFLYIPAHIPAGTRIAMRCQADNATAGVRNLIGAAVIGLR